MFSFLKVVISLNRLMNIGSTDHRKVFIQTPLNGFRHIQMTVCHFDTVHTAFLIECCMFWPPLGRIRLLTIPSGMVPKHKSALLFGFTKSILVVFLFQWIGIRQEDGIKVSGCHGSRNLTALNQKYPQLLSLFPTKVERTVMIRNNILFVRAVLNMFCQ